ncbi:amino acid adenylation domain-containing protein [Microbulbifer sp. TYP-18]|uniref:amino acid adenylation domain-containing protein n=1 Tax=Microbulbifer sp. TYP-18 TaxID=3230024 RepID=UPI0034C639A0
MDNKQMQLERYPSIPERFNWICAHKPDNIAIKYLNRSLSYRELEKCSNYLAKHLSECGVTSGDIVAIALPRSFEMVISMIAILKCGAAYFPLDESNPIARNHLCLTISKAKLVVCNAASRVQYAKHCSVVNIDDVDVFQSQYELGPERDIHEEDKAYVMFTSGSTGNPKGVIVPHRAVSRLVIKTNFIEINESDAILQFAPASFDASTFEIWGAILNGATLVLYSGAVLDPNLLKRELLDNKVTIMWLTAALFHLVSERFIEALKPLRVMLAGGDVLNSKNILTVLESIPNITVVNGYGPTENTTFTCCHRMTASNPPGMHVPIGRAVSGTSIHILDEQDRAVNPGEVGELIVSGAGVALGYLGDSKCANAFFTNSDIDEGLLYRTGDLVCENPSGELSFIGRRDNQIKIRGYRISLEEIRSAIAAISEVIDALVIRKVMDSGDQILVAYIAIGETSELTIKIIREKLLKILPAYMIPDQIIVNSDLPINSNGKIDKAKLQSADMN